MSERIKHRFALVSSNSPHPSSPRHLSSYSSSPKQGNLPTQLASQKLVIILLLLPLPQTPPLILLLSTLRLKEFLARNASQTIPETTTLSFIGIRRILDRANGADPLPHSADIARAAFAHHRTHVGVRLNFLLDFLPQFRAARSRELVSQDVVAELCHADIALGPRGRVDGVQAGLLVQLLQRKAGELLGLFFGVAVVGDAVAAVEGACRQEREAYKLPKIFSKCSQEGSADGAAEGNSGEAV
jgi:hypothetical protein